jgi:hypothetical protein
MAEEGRSRRTAAPDRFLSPEHEHGRQTNDGTRPLDADVAAESAGLLLRSFPIRSSALIDRDAVDLEVEDDEELERARNEAYLTTGGQVLATPRARLWAETAG